MSIKESLGKGFKVTGQSMNLVLILFVFGAVWNVLNVFLAPKTQNPQLSASAGLIILAVVFGLVSIYLQAGSLGFILNNLKTGGRDLSSFMQSGGKFYARLLVLGLIVAAVAGVLVLVAALLMAATAGNVVAIVVTVAIAATGIYFAILIFLAPYIIVADDQKVMVSVRQSIALVKKNLLKVLGLAVLLILIGFGVGLLLGVLFAALSAVMKGTAPQIVFAVLSSFVNSYLGVLVSASFMAFYLALSGSTGAGSRSLSDMVK